MSSDATPRLPPLPPFRVKVARDRTAGASATGGFLNVSRLDLVVEGPEGDASRTFPYDIATRASLDAVIIAAHYREAGATHVFLRSAVRPPLQLRSQPPAWEASLWELPAGLIDGEESPAEAAARELEEELGFDVRPDGLAELGPWVFPAPAFIGEVHHFFHVEVDPGRRGTPRGDGSVLEKGAVIVAVPLSAALRDCADGVIRDSKTELALRRLQGLLR